MEQIEFRKDFIDLLVKQSKKKYIIHKKNIKEDYPDDFNPIFGFKLSSRFLTSMGLLADVFEYLDHVTNFENTKDTLLFLLIASGVLYTYNLALIYIPILLVIKVLHVLITKEIYAERELKIKRSYRIVQRIMRDTSDYVEFFDLFLKTYVYWNDKDKTFWFVIEMLKLSFSGILVYLFIPLNWVLILGLWYSTLQRSHFFWWLFNVTKEFSRKMAVKFVGTKYQHLFDPPLEGLIELLKKEKTNFTKNALEPFEFVHLNSSSESESSSNEEETPNDFFQRLFRRKKSAKKISSQKSSEKSEKNEGKFIWFKMTLFINVC